MITPATIRESPIIVGILGTCLYFITAITIIGIFKYKQIPNLPTIAGLALIIIGVIIVNTMNNIKVEN